MILLNKLYSILLALRALKFKEQYFTSNPISHVIQLIATMNNKNDMTNYEV